MLLLSNVDGEFVEDELDDIDVVPLLLEADDETGLGLDEVVAADEAWVDTDAMLPYCVAEDEKLLDISLFGWDVGNVVELLSMLYEIEVEGVEIEGAGALLLNEVVDSVEETKDWRDDDIAEETGLVASAVKDVVAESGVFETVEDLLLEDVIDDCGAPLDCTATDEDTGLLDKDGKLLDDMTDDEDKLLDGVDVDGDDDAAALDDDGDVFSAGEGVEVERLLLLGCKVISDAGD